jgi:Putative glycerate kinase
MAVLATREQRSALLADLYWAAVTAAAPGPALSAALASHPSEPKRRVHLLALGKAAYPMAVAAVAALKGARPGSRRRPARHSGTNTFT